MCRYWEMSWRLNDKKGQIEKRNRHKKTQQEVGSFQLFNIIPLRWKASEENGLPANFYMTYLTLFILCKKPTNYLVFLYIEVIKCFLHWKSWKTVFFQIQSLTLNWISMLHVNIFFQPPFPALSTEQKIEKKTSELQKAGLFYVTGKILIHGLA